MKQVKHFRDRKWTDSIAVGSRAFVIVTKERLGIRAKARKMVGTDDNFELRESGSLTMAFRGMKMRLYGFKMSIIGRIPFE